jgi:hypothetical protein
MQILKSTRPVVVELSRDDIAVIHLALYQYKTWLKYDKTFDKHSRRKRLVGVNRMKALVDLMMNV